MPVNLSDQALWGLTINKIIPKMDELLGRNKKAPINLMTVSNTTDSPFKIGDRVLVKGSTSTNICMLRVDTTGQPVAAPSPAAAPSIEGRNEILGYRVLPTLDIRHGLMINSSFINTDLKLVKKDVFANQKIKFIKSYINFKDLDVLLSKCKHSIVFGNYTLFLRTLKELIYSYSKEYKYKLEAGLKEEFRLVGDGTKNRLIGTITALNPNIVHNVFNPIENGKVLLISVLDRFIRCNNIIYKQVKSILLYFGDTNLHMVDGTQISTMYELANDTFQLFTYKAFEYRFLFNNIFSRRIRGTMGRISSPRLKSKKEKITVAAGKRLGGKVDSPNAWLDDIEPNNINESIIPQPKKHKKSPWYPSPHTDYPVDPSEVDPSEDEAPVEVKIQYSKHLDNIDYRGKKIDFNVYYDDVAKNPPKAGSTNIKMVNVKKH